MVYDCPLRSFERQEKESGLRSEERQEKESGLRLSAPLKKSGLRLPSSDVPFFYIFHTFMC